MHDTLPVGAREGSGDLIEDLPRSVELERPLSQRVLQAPAAEEAHDQERGVRLSPVVVQGHDVRVLQARDPLRLVLEAADEVGLVRQLDVDRLHRDLPLDLWLDRPVHDAERALPHLPEQSVAAQVLPGELQRLLLAQDPAVELSELA
ncbi:hypothetical protein HRbin12_01681 [bacterium HR12]|nr:hypothetical protein HRbin12_01681 [bacterium HR12]